MVYNYCAVATNVQYVPYLLGSLVGMMPEVIASIYTYDLSFPFFCLIGRRYKYIIFHF
jgi:uncharacterized membrane protein YdjX (TVP38/TMEM64 family)